MHDAFPGASVSVDAVDGRFETTMQQDGPLRPLKAVELSDGTLRYLLWIAALLSPPGRIEPADVAVGGTLSESLNAHPGTTDRLGVSSTAWKRSSAMYAAPWTQPLATLHRA